MHDIDPRIPVCVAIRFAGNQSNLARILKMAKSSVCEWGTSGREFVPPLQAWRLWRLQPGYFGEFLPEAGEVPGFDVHVS